MDIPTIAPPPENVPLRSDMANFAAYREAWLLWEKDELFPGLDATVAGVNAITPSLSLIMGVQNNKGAWSGLTGPLNVPASVVHANAFWVLKENVANVAAEEPGVSTKWQKVTATSRYELLGTYDYAVTGAVTNIDFTGIPQDGGGLFLEVIGLQHNSGSNQQLTAAIETDGVPTWGSPTGGLTAQANNTNLFYGGVLISNYAGDASQWKGAVHATTPLSNRRVSTLTGTNSVGDLAAYHPGGLKGIRLQLSGSASTTAGKVKLWKVL